MIFLPGIYANEELQTILRLLERHPDLLPRMLDLLMASLRDEAIEQVDPLMLNINRARP
jgi:hypothetical protein